MPKNKGKLYADAVKYLIGLIQPHKKWYFIASGLAVLSAAVGLLNTRTTQRLIDSAAMGQIDAIVHHALLLALIIVVNFALTRMRGISVAVLAAGASRDMKRRVACALIYADYKETIRLNAGDTLSTVNSDTETVSDFLGGDLIGLFAQAVMLLGAVIYLLATNPILFFITFAYTPIGMFFTLTLNKKMQQLYPVKADRAGEALSVIEQALAQIPVIKSFLMEKMVRQKVAAGCSAVLGTELEIAKWDALLQPACQSTSSMPRILYLLFAGWLVMRGEMTLGAYIAVFDLLFFIVGPTVYFPFMLNGLNKAVASMHRVKQLERIPQAERAKEAPAWKEEPEIIIRNLSYGYDTQKTVLSSLSFSHRGTGIVAVKGASGSGKTTLLDLIAGLLTPAEGSITTNRNIAVLPQHEFLFSDTVMNNVRLGSLHASQEDIRAAIADAGADDIDPTMLVGDSGTALSGGQGQRVSLARIILSDAPIWLLDEPTSALDADTERVILNTLEREKSRRLIIISAHRESLLHMADTVLDLDAAGGAAL